MMAAELLGRWGDNDKVHYFDYSEDNIKWVKAKGIAWVSEAFIHEHEGGGGQCCGLRFLLTDQEINDGVEIADAIRRAVQERDELVKEMLANPQWGKNAIYKWDGSFLEWQDQRRGGSR